MTNAHHDQQAEAFLDWFARDRHPSPTIHESFDRWSASKDFSPVDRNAIFAHIGVALASGWTD